MLFGTCIRWLPRRLQPRHEKAAETEVKDIINVEKNEWRKASGTSSETSHVTGQSRTLRQVAEKIAGQFEVSDQDLRVAVEGFLAQLNDGLQANGTSIEQLPSFIDRLPSGTEHGTYLALDLGGTNIRICLVTFNGDRTYSVVQNKKAIPASLMTARTSEELFRWVAQTVDDFIKANLGAEAATGALHLGFTFSHALNQHSINSGTLIRWSKGFSIDEAVGKDICALLQEAFVTLGVYVKVDALLNDTVGTLLACTYQSPTPHNTILGAVFGTGTNGAYVEQSQRIVKLSGHMRREKDIMLMNTEWGNFDPELKYLPNTIYDKELDQTSVNPGIEMFEKRISGMYLGELLRLAVLDLHKQDASGSTSHPHIPQDSGLFLPHSLDSSFLTDLENDTSVDLHHSRIQIEQWLGTEVEFELALSVRLLAKAIGTRSARLSAAAVGAAIEQTECLISIPDGEDVVIGVDGSLIELYPCFVPDMRHALRCLEGVGPAGEARLKIVVVKDGSAVGAALAAHIAANSA